MEDKDIDDKNIEVQEDDDFGERSNVGDQVSNENVNSLNRQDIPEFDGNSHVAHKQPVKNAYVMPLPTFFASLYNKKPVNDEYEKPSTSKRQSEKPIVVFPSTSTHHDRLDVKQKRKCNQGIIFKPKAYQRAPAPQRLSTFMSQIGKLADTKPENTFKHKTANYKDFPKYEPRFTPKKKRLRGSRNMGPSTESIGNYHYRLAPNSRPDSFRFENWTYCFDRPSTSTSVADKSCKRSKGKEETETTKKDESKSEKDPNKETE